MVACAKFLGRTSNSCTRKPDGCICEKKEILQDFISKKKPLPKGTQMWKTGGILEYLTDSQLDSANRVPNTMSDTDPFWIHGWSDLHSKIVINYQG